MSKDFYWWEYVDRQAEREAFWLQRIKEQEFLSGLMICGYVHLLRFAFRLKSAQYGVESACYMPHRRRCDHENRK
jgi:hypothetical protein